MILRNQTTEEIMMLGTNEYAWEGTEVSTPFIISGRTPTLTSQTTIRLDHWIQSPAPGGANALGLSHE
ncbi:MAG: hypothetical protein R2792_15800 [Saprospiraceae bacterium]